MSPENTPDTIVLIHGLWMTPRSWEKWIERYEDKGYRVLAPHTRGPATRSSKAARTTLLGRTVGRR